jgi:superfamily II DNA or RNA helicase
MKVEFDVSKHKAILLGKHLPEVREHFSIYNPAAKFSRSFFTPKRLYAITPNGYFDIGLTEEISKYLLENRGIKLEISDLVKSKLNPKLDKPLICRLNKELRDYQLEAVTKSINIGRGVCLMGTGAGKTLTMASLIDNFYLHSKNIKKFKCLVIVPDLGLVSQTYNEFIDYNVSFNVTMWTGSNKPDMDAEVFIANIAILQNRFSQNEWLKDVDLLIVDEAHKLNRGNKIVKIVDSIKTNNKFGFTGTLPEDKLDQWNLLGKIGPVIISKNSFELRSNNYLTNVEVKVLNINYKIGNKLRLGDSESAYANELNYIYNSSYRNNIIEKTCSFYKNNILILVNHLTHGEILLNLLSEKLQDKKVYFIKGEVEINQREEIKKLIESNDNIICIAMSSIFSTGVSVNNIHYIIFASGGKSFVRTVQSIGRGLRLNKNKEKLIILDFADNLYYGSKHSEKRKEIYELETIPYTEKIISEK